MRPPSAIIVVRHGARLDAADRDWHLSSPAPYDPPLTYGGWNQSKALGARIASIVQARANFFDSASASVGTETHSKENGTKLRSRKRKQKVIIHTSPFLRCLQTSVAIGAGVSQSIEEAESLRRRGRGIHKRSVQNEEEEVKEQDVIKTTLRVDAFLGEWLSPDYFRDITPPPDSTLMVASAKAHLLRREQIQVFKPSTSGLGNFPGGWSRTNGSKIESPTATSAISEDSESVPRLSESHPHYRASSYSVHGAFADGSASTRLKTITSSITNSKSLYDPPIPAYAIAPSDPIPRGYCVHARDACADVDLLWDSMRQPQDWGDGGELGEEWSGMHRRFRTGLNKMISWYKRHTPEFHPDREDPLALYNDEEDEEEEEDDDGDDDYDLVLVLVTHSAGCNALVGALTNHPVLLDFALTSLSMAIRKEVNDDSVSESHAKDVSSTERTRDSFESGLSAEYEMKMVASTSHLRAGVEAGKLAALRSPHLVPQIPAFRFSGHADSAHAARNSTAGIHAGAKSPSSMSIALGSIRQNSSNPTSRDSSIGHRRPNTSRSGSSSGLWSKTTITPSSIDENMRDLSIGPPAELRAEAPDTNDPLPSVPKQSSVQKLFAIGDHKLAPRPQLVGRALSEYGLWGPPPTTVATRVRDSARKRRWTVSEPDEDNI